MNTQTMRQLELFAQVVATGSIAECADLFGMSAEAVVHDLMTLEERLGLHLLTIENGYVLLTAVGHKTAQAMSLLSGVAPEHWDSVHAPEEPAVPDSMPETAENGEETGPEDQEEADSPEPSCAVPPQETGTQDKDDTDPPSSPFASLLKSVRTGERDRSGGGTDFAEVWPELDDEPLELTEIAPDWITAREGEGGHDSAPASPEARPTHETPARDMPARETVARLPTARPAEAPVALAGNGHAPLGTLAVRLAFAAPAPATAKLPTVVTLFAADPDLPVPANDPEAPLPAEPPPVIALDQSTRQQVTLAAHPSVFGHFQEALAAFEQANPDVAINLELNAFTAARAEPMLASGEVDILYYYAMGERERFESRYVWSESLSIFIGADHPLASRDSVTINDLIDVRPILLGSRNGLRPVLDNAMRRSGVDLWQPALETDDLMEIMAAVRMGLGYFAAFGPLARDFGRMEGIRRLPIVDPLPPVEVRQAVREEIRDDPVVASLAEYLFR